MSELNPEKIRPIDSLLIQRILDLMATMNKYFPEMYHSSESITFADGVIKMVNNEWEDKEEKDDFVKSAGYESWEKLHRDYYNVIVKCIAELEHEILGRTNKPYKMVVEITHTIPVTVKGHNIEQVKDKAIKHVRDKGPMNMPGTTNYTAKLNK